MLNWTHFGKVLAKFMGQDRASELLKNNKKNITAIVQHLLQGGLGLAWVWGDESAHGGKIVGVL